MLLYLARHAQTASSAVDSFNGQRELPLTEHGREQARKLGQRLAGVRFAAVYRSPLGRTAETAAKFGSVTIPGTAGTPFLHGEGPLQKLFLRQLLDPHRRIGAFLEAAQKMGAKFGVPGVKYAMDLNGYYGGLCRLPLLPLTADEKGELERLVRDIKN